tara:strand:+ start:478 stop:834 length:357 start_codon:yes stop_codon:yes gene_type:complete
MGIITKIDGIPLFNAEWKALRWGEKFNLKGTHVHFKNGQKGWMPGTSHVELQKVFIVRKDDTQIIQPTQPMQAVQPVQPIAQPAAQPVQTPQPVQQPVQQPTYTPPASTPSGGGGGGY